ncbi:MAG TPA: hypothetical protein VIK74_00370 [Parasegetibacter sp.]
MFTICELIFAMLFFHFVFQHPIAKKVALGIAGAFLIYSSYYFYVEREFGYYGSIPATVESIIIICVSIYYLFEQINSPQSFFIYLTPQFWVVIGLLIFFAGSFFLFIYASDFSKSELARYWNINYTFNILKNLFFSIGFLMKNNKKGYPSLDRKYFS